MLRNIKLLLFAVLFTNFQIFKFSHCHAQVPQKFNYQGIARDAKGNPLSQKRMTLKLTVLPTSDATEGEYEEIQTVTTNEFGLYTLQIGNGSPLKGEMSAVKWETGNKYIKVAIDPKGGSDFVDAGTNQLLSVPYAIYADKAGVAKNSGSTSRATNNFIEKTDGSGVVNSTSQIYDNGTNIGIGTITPSARVHVNANSASVQEHIRMQNLSSTGAGRFTMYNNNTSAYATFTKYGTNYPGGYAGIVSLYPYANLLAFGNNDTNAAGNGNFLISSEGNTGISIFKGGTSKLKYHVDYASENVGLGGNASPTSRVHINNTDGAIVNLKLTNTTTGHATNDGLLLDLNGNSASIVNNENAPLTFGTNLTEKMRITQNGDIGIGTTAPAAKLDIVGQIRIQGGSPGLGKVLTSDATGIASWSTISGVTSVNGNTGAVTTIDGSGSIGFVPQFTAPKVIGNSIIKIDSARVGINFANPHGELQLGNTTNNRKVVLYESANNNHGFYGFGVNSGILRFQIPSGANYAFYSQAGSLDLSNEIMRLTSSGNLGIGTTLPTEKLVVSGNTLINNGGNLTVETGDLITTIGDLLIGGTGEIKMGASTGNRKIVMYEQVANDHQFYGFGINAGITRYQVPATTNSHVFYAGTTATTSNELMRIQGNGNVGIGVTNPTSQLQLSLNSASKPTSSTWTISSDARLKTVDGAYTKGLSEIIKLNTVAYHYKKGNARNLPIEEQGIGFVAQELQQIFPEAVKQDSDGYLSVDIHPILVSYINAIKELDTKNKTLEEQLKTQQTMYSELLKRIETLETK